jgi:hypothetical protein
MITSFKLMITRYAKETNNYVASRKLSISGYSVGRWRKDKDQLLFASLLEKHFVDVNRAL